MRSVGIAVVGLLALFAVYAGVARATGGGGGTIASAPVVTAGVQQAGDTSSFSDSCQNGYEFWTLQLKQGDLVKVTWGTPPGVDTVALWPAGTNDAKNDGCLYASGWASDWTTSPLVSDSNATPGTTLLSQEVAPADGSYPLLFLDTTGANNAGAYSFTAVVLHAASVSLPHLSNIPDSGQMTASALAPDGTPITDPSLQLTLSGFWGNHAHTLATATPSNGIATFNYTVPNRRWGTKIRMQVTGAGSSYQAVKSQKESAYVLIPTSAPVALSLAQLKAESTFLRQPIYWAGPRKGFRYEFTLTTSGYAYVRYLPRGVPVGATGSRFLIVATYPFPGAYSALQKFAHGKAVAGPHRSIYFVDPTSPKSVFVAFRHVNYEIEVYDPSPAVARTIAATGRVRPVRS